MAALPDRLSALQGAVKRDPTSYVEEYRLQVRAFEAELALLRLRLSSDSASFRALVLFLAQTAACFPDEPCALPAQLSELLSAHAAALAPDVRRASAKALMLMRARNVISAPVPLLKLFFSLFRVRDRALRELIFSHVVSDCSVLARAGRSAFSGKKRRRSGGAAVAEVAVRLPPSDNAAATRAVQAFLYSAVTDDSIMCARMSLQVIVELYRRSVWTDARTVNVIASTLGARRTKLVVCALKFFLGIGAGGSGDGSESDDTDSDEDFGGHARAAAGSAIAPTKANVQEIEKNMAHVKKTRKRKRDAAKAFADIKRSQRKAQARGDGARPVFPAIALIHDPQGVAEGLFASLRSGAISREKFEVRLLALNFVSRLIGQHRLMLLPLYSFLGRYLAAHQAHVTQVLAYLIQATHDGVPPDELSSTVRAIANSFVVASARVEVMQVGLNALREIFFRCPALLAEPGMDALVTDLVAHKNYKGSKGVVTAARSILNLVRDLYPSLLARRDRGIAAALDPSVAAARPTPFGAKKLATNVEGADLLALLLADKARRTGTAEVVGLGDTDEWRRIEKVREKAAAGGGTLKRKLAAAPIDDDAAALLELMNSDDEGGAGSSGAEDGDDGSGADEDDSDEDDDEEGHGANMTDGNDDDEDDEEDDDDSDDDDDGDDDDNDDDEEEEDEASDDEVSSEVLRNTELNTGDGQALRGGAVGSQKGSTSGPSFVQPSISSQRTELAARLASMLSGAGGSGAAGTSATLASTISSERILTPKDFARMKKLRLALAEKGITRPSAADIIELIGAGSGSTVVSSARGRVVENDGEIAWKAHQLRKRRRKAGRGLGDAPDEDAPAEAADAVLDDVEDAETMDQLAAPGTFYEPPTVTFDPNFIESAETGRKRQQAATLLDIIKGKQAKKFEGKKVGGGATNKDKARKKNFLMLRKSSAVQGKLKRSLREQGKVIRGKIKGDKKMDRRQKQRRRRY